MYVIFRHISEMVFLNLEYERKMIKFRYTISVSVCRYVKTRNASLFYSSLIIQKQQLYPSSYAPCSNPVRLRLTGAQLPVLRYIIYPSSFRAKTGIRHSGPAHLFSFLSIPEYKFFQFHSMLRSFRNLYTVFKIT